MAKLSPDKYLHFDDVRHCPLCNSDGQEVLSRRMQFDLNCTTVICKTCGFCFVSPAPTREAYSAFYREAYASYYQKIHPETFSKHPLRESPSEKIRLDIIETHKPLRGARVLEIGVGRGHFLRMVAKRGAFACAIEPSDEFRSSLEQSGISIIGDFLENTATDQQFDLIMLFQVLEHFHDPVDAVRRMKQLLAPDGIIVLDVPNIWKPFRNLDHYFLRYVHLSYFSPQTLKRLFLGEGLEVSHIDEGGASVVTPNQLFAVFRQGSVVIGNVDSCRDDWRLLLAHLNRYRRIYPCLHAPVFHLKRLWSVTRRGLANSPVGDAYRQVKAMRQGRLL